MAMRRNDRSLRIICTILYAACLGLAAASYTVDRRRIVASLYGRGRQGGIRASSDIAAPNVIEVPLLGQQSVASKDDFLFGALSCRGGDDNARRLSKYFVGSKSKCWTVLMLAIMVDSCTIIMMKVAQDEGSVVKLAISYCGYFLSMFGFALSLNSLDISIAYAVWAALGTAIVSTVGILKFNEDFDAAKLGCLAMIILGVVGLNLRGM